MERESYTVKHLLKHIHIAYLVIFGLFACFTGLLLAEVELPAIFIKVMGIVMSTSLFVGAIALCLRHFVFKKNILEMVFGIAAIISYLLFVFPIKTYESPICSCCDEYLIPEEILVDKVGPVAIILTVICLVFSCIHVFKKSEIKE